MVRRTLARPAQSPMRSVPRKVCASALCASSDAYDVVAGPIKTATVELEGFKVDNQVFSECTNVTLGERF